MANIFVIKLGGSMLSKGENNVFDFEYLRDLRSTLNPFVQQGDKFFIVLGGGYTMRKYRDLAMAAGLQEKEQLHWIGTTVNVLHAEIVRAYYHDISDEGVFKYEDYYQDANLTITKSIKVGGGGRPGHSGDVDAVLAAKKVSSKTIISLKNVDGVYDKDPSKNPDAVRQEKLSWDKYLDIIGNKDEHEPGGNYPIDTIASRMSKDSDISFNVLHGNDLQSLSSALKGEEFTGTIVGN